MRWKSTCGMTFVSTSATIWFTSPCLIDLSDLSVSSTSEETSLMSTSGALPACACTLETAPAKPSSKANEPAIHRFENMSFPFE